MTKAIVARAPFAAIALASGTPDRPDQAAVSSRAIRCRDVGYAAAWLSA
jgi:hypothetical protein